MVAATFSGWGEGGGVDGGAQPPEADTQPAEYAMWCAVLALLLDDARAYWHGVNIYGAANYEAEQAFDDVMRVGPMLRWCCNQTGHNPQWIAERFNASLKV